MILCILNKAVLHYKTKPVQRAIVVNISVVDSRMCGVDI